MVQQALLRPLSDLLVRHRYGPHPGNVLAAGRKVGHGELARHKIPVRESGEAEGSALVGGGVGEEGEGSLEELAS